MILSIIVRISLHKKPLFSLDSREQTTYRIRDVMNLSEEKRKNNDVKVYRERKMSLRQCAKAEGICEERKNIASRNSRDNF